MKGVVAELRGCLAGGYADAATFTAVLGPSGAGKSTLLDCLALRNRDFRGALLLDGVPFTGPFGSMAGRTRATTCPPQ